MAVNNFNDDLNIISKLGNNPNSDNNLSDAGLKAKFDSAGLLIQKFLNDVLIPAVNRLENAVGFKGTHGELTGRDAANQHPISAINGLQAALNSANSAANNAMTLAAAKTSVATDTVVLYSNIWYEGKQSISTPAIPASAKAVIASPELSDENYETYSACGVRCVAKTATGLEFVCDSVPDIDLTVELTGFL